MLWSSPLLSTTPTLFQMFRRSSIAILQRLDDGIPEFLRRQFSILPLCVCARERKCGDASLGGNGELGDSDKSGEVITGLGTCTLERWHNSRQGCYSRSGVHFHHREEEPSIHQGPYVGDMVQMCEHVQRLPYRTHLSVVVMIHGRGTGWTVGSTYWHVRVKFGRHMRVGEMWWAEQRVSTSRLAFLSLLFFFYFLSPILN